MVGEFFCNIYLNEGENIFFKVFVLKRFSNNEFLFKRPLGLNFKDIE